MCVCVYPLIRLQGNLPCVTINAQKIFFAATLGKLGQTFVSGTNIGVLVMHKKQINKVGNRIKMFGNFVWKVFILSHIMFNGPYL